MGPVRSLSFDSAIRRVNSDQINRVYRWGMLGLVPLAVGAVGLNAVFGQDVARTVFTWALPVFALAYIVLLNRALVPAEQGMRVTVDPDGIRSGTRWLARAGDIAAVHVCRPSQGAAVKGVQVPAWPWTVYVLTPRDRFWVVVDDQAEGERLLVALDRPRDVRDLSELATLPEDSARRGRMPRLAVLVAVALVAIAVGAAMLVAASH